MICVGNEFASPHWIKWPISQIEPSSLSGKCKTAYQKIEQRQIEKCWNNRLISQSFEFFFKNDNHWWSIDNYSNEWDNDRSNESNSGPFFTNFVNIRIHFFKQQPQLKSRYLLLKTTGNNSQCTNDMVFPTFIIPLLDYRTEKCTRNS